MVRYEPSSRDLFLEKIKTTKIGIQGNNPHIFLWHLYDQKSKKKKIFSTQWIKNLVRIKKCP